MNPNVVPFESIKFVVEFVVLHSFQGIQKYMYKVFQFLAVFQLNAKFEVLMHLKLQYPNQDQIVGAKFSITNLVNKIVQLVGLKQLEPIDNIQIQPFVFHHVLLGLVQKLEYNMYFE